MKFLAADFFERDPVDCARELIGAHFIWHGCEGVIVETEAYAAAGDPACHTFFRPSSRSFVEQLPAGTAYVYLNYGVHWLFNVLVKGPQGAGFVLFRALEPVTGLERMIARRGRTDPRDLCSGPGKLTRALGIDGAAHGSAFLGPGKTGIRRGPSVEVIAAARIGISRARDLPWRFLAAGNPHVSRPA
jgi:DNA-3-methyladenine glycosylase